MRGQPDFGALAAKEVTASISDMGEVAARLGSIVIYDKRGDVVVFDTFEDPVFKWSVARSHAACYARLDNTHVKSGGQAALLYVTNIAGAVIAVEKTLSLVASKQLGIEISWHGEFDVNHLRFYIYRNTPTHSTVAEVFLDSITNKIYVYVSPTEYYEVASIPDWHPYSQEFRTLKLVLDFNALKYKRLLIDLDEYDLSDVSIYSVGLVGTPYINIGFEQITPGGVARSIWVDDFILTQAEP